MAEARRMGKSELFSHFADRFEMKRTQAREYFDELTALAEKELKRSGVFRAGLLFSRPVVPDPGRRFIAAAADEPLDFLNPQPGHPEFQAAERHVQGARRGGGVPAVLLERADQVVPRERRNRLIEQIA